MLAPVSTQGTFFPQSDFAELFGVSFLARMITASRTRPRRHETCVRTSEHGDISERFQKSLPTTQERAAGVWRLRLVNEQGDEECPRARGLDGFCRAACPIVRKQRAGALFPPLPPPFSLT